LRRGRILARVREGWAYDEVAREEQLTPERVRRIVREALAQRIVDDETDHARGRLGARIRKSRPGPTKIPCRHLLIDHLASVHYRDTDIRHLGQTVGQVRSVASL